MNTKTVVSESEAMPDQTPTPPEDDVSKRRFVRILQRTASGLVRFEFSMGWPDLGLELVLPTPAFDVFCERQAVVFLDPEARSPQLGDAVDDDCEPVTKV